MLMRKVTYPLALSVLVLSAIYLVAVNTALSLEATRTYLNHMQPERFQLTWQRAWSLFPLRVELTGVAADGQTPTEQWQLDAARAAASVSLLPLLRGEIRVHDLDLVDTDLRLRPRSKPRATLATDPQADEADPADALSRFYPVIRNRDPSAPAEPVPDDEHSSLVLEIDDIHIKGEHTFWVSHMRAAATGEIRGSLRLDTRAGRIGLAGGALDLELTSLKVGPDEPVTGSASVIGEIDIPPFRLSDTKGLQFLRVGDLDAAIDLPVENLDFLALFIPILDKLGLSSGRGRLHGRAVLSSGEALRGTDLVVEAGELVMDLGAYHFSGDGSIEFLVDPADEAQADLIVRFDQVQGQVHNAPGPHEVDGAEAPQLLFTGRGLTAQLHAAETDPTTTSSAVKAEELLSEVELNLLLRIPSMQVADLAVYNRLFPDSWGLELLGGTGTVSGQIEVASELLSLNLELASDNADLRYRDHHGTADLLLQLRARVDETAGATLHLDGSSLRIDDAEVRAAGQTNRADEPHHAEPWMAAVKISEGALTLPTSTEGAAVPSVAKLLENRGLGALLDTADGHLSATVTVSRLDWIAELLNRPLDLSLTGSAELDAEIVLGKGRPARGTTLKVPREALSLALLEHRVDGWGTAALRLEKGGKRPRLRLDVALEDARMRRRDEPEPSIGEVRMDAEILVTDPLADSGGAADVTLKLHSARVQNMSSYNAYLPAKVPLSLISGEASLVGDLRFKPHGTAGELLLVADGVRVALDGEELSGKLRLDLQVRDGSAEKMWFDITGSSVVLDDFQVIGKVRSAREPSWHARLQLEETEVLWHKPMRLNMSAGIAIKDSRPFVALLDNARGEHDWIDNLLTIEDLGGHLKLILDGKRAVLSDSFLGSERISIRAKGQADAGGREGMLYVRWHDLAGALELRGTDRQFHVNGARARFDAYAPGKPTSVLKRLEAIKQGSAATNASGLRKPAVPPPGRRAVVPDRHPGSSPNAEKAPSQPVNPFLSEDL